MVDMMRANRLGANQYIIGGSSVSKTQITAGEALCLDRNKADTKYWKFCDDKRKIAEDIAAQEAKKWKEGVEKGLPNGSAEIGASDRGGIYVFTVKITWTVGNEKNTAVENPVTDSLQMSFAL